MNKVRVGLIGSAFISTIHAEALKRVAGAELVAVVSPTPGHAKAFADKHGIPHAFTDLDAFLAAPTDLVVVGCPNDLHADMTVRAAAAGKHVVCEKPLALNLAEADRMIEACRRAKVKLMYAEELCFTPKYVRLKRLVDEGAVGRPHLVKQSEKHDGPHAAWFWDTARSGGGVTMDMGCHALEFFRWMLGTPLPADGDTIPVRKARALSVTAHMGTYVHGARTRGDDEALITVRFQTDGGEAVGLAEESWTKKGGMEDAAEVAGSAGVAYANLLRGNAIVTYSETGYGYAVEKASTTRGWSFTTWEEIWNYGFPQEFSHFVDCVAHDREPAETGEDGRAVLEMLLAAYASAGQGRTIALPFASDARRPIDLWRPS